MLLALIGDSANLFWPAGSVVFERGTQPDGLYVVVSGLVDVVGDDGQAIAALGPGDFFGELSLLRGTAHGHEVRAAEAAELLVVPKETFEDLLAANPELGRHIRGRAEERLAASAPGGMPESP